MDKIETPSEEEPPPRRQNLRTLDARKKYACRVLESVFHKQDERMYLVRAIRAARKDPCYLESLDIRKIPYENLGGYNQFMDCYLKRACYKLEELSRLNGFHENRQTIPEFVGENVKPFLTAWYFEREKARGGQKSLMETGQEA